MSPKQSKNKKAVSNIKQQQKDKAESQFNAARGNLVCSILMILLGVMSAPRALSIAFNEEHFPAWIRNNSNQLSLLNFYMLCGVSLFILSVLTVLSRVLSGKGLPAEFPDANITISLNQLITNIITYTVIFSGLFYQVLNTWKINQSVKELPFYIQIYPFLIFGCFGLEFLCRFGEIISGVKGIRYLAHGIINVLLAMLVIEVLEVKM